MLAYTFYNCICTGVTYCEALACHTIDKGSSAGGSIKGNISYNNVIFCFVACIFRSFQDQLTAGKAFAKVVIAVACKLQGETLGDKCTKALSAGSCTVDFYSVFRKSLFVISGNLSTKDGSKCTVCVFNSHRELCFFTISDCTAAFFEQDPFIQCFFQLEVVLCFRVKGYLAAFSCKWIVQDGTKINLSLVRLVYSVCSNKKISTSYHFLQAANTKLCHIFTKLLCNKAHEVFYVFRFALEAFSKLRVLGGNTNRAGIQIAHSHHHAAHSYKGSSCKAKFLCTKKCGNSNVTAAHQLAVCLNADTVSKAIHKKGLMCFRKSKLPGKSCIMDGASRSSSCTSVIAGNQNNLCASLCNTSCYSAHTSLRNQFYGNICIFVCIFQVIDQLCQLLNGIDVMMGRRGDQADTRGGMTGFCNPRVNLLCRKVSAFTWLCALCHFDLDFFCRYQIAAGNAKTSAGYLLDS